MYDIGQGLYGCLLIVFIAGFAVCGLLFWAIPIIWAWVKPWLHAITA